MTDELVAWLREQVDEDERVAQAATKLARWSQAAPGEVVSKYGDETFVVAVRVQSWNAAHIARHDPVRVLAEVAAKRRIIDLHPANPPIDEQWSAARKIWSCPTCSDADDGPQEWPCPTIQALASVYAGRPGWREEWSADEEVSRG